MKVKLDSKDIALIKIRWIQKATKEICALPDGFFHGMANHGDKFQLNMNVDVTASWLA